MTKESRRQWPGCLDESLYKQRLICQLLRHVSVDERTGCWNWAASLQRNGYTQTRAWGKMMPAHRAAFLVFNGPISAGLEVCHSCDNKKCINPNHLTLGTHQSNMRDAKERGLMLAGVRHPNFGKPAKAKGINHPTSKPVEVNGVIYGSLKEAERMLRLGHGTVKYLVSTGRARAITREEYLNGK